MAGECVALVEQSTKGIEDGELDGGTEEGELLRLAVDVDDARAELAEALGGGRLAVDASRGAPGETHVALDGQALLAHAHGGEDTGALGTIGDDTAPVPPAEEEVEGIDDDRLAGARLACEHVEAGAWGEGDVAGHGEAGDGELLNHRYSWRC